MQSERERERERERLELTIVEYEIELLSPTTVTNDNKSQNNTFAQEHRSRIPKDLAEEELLDKYEIK
ncbi:hypothetical protein T07_520 [Trichinella nelsoni]|uniref:Uncharacterized protein n=1 Tax=Trichinella nelsoni TaxID=6336 RepID=A0A0V0RKE8_9BILA|nr:hypothetical protein T07_520 [Trichinella nelsoni]